MSIGVGEYGAASASMPYDINRPRYVRITDINDDGSLNNDCVCSSIIEDDITYKLNYGDFLFARMGATVGKTYAYRGGNQIYAGYLIRFKLDTEKLIPQYLFWYTKTPIYNTWVKENQSGAAQPGINAKKYASLEIPLLSLPEQQKIAAHLDSIQSAIDNKKQQLQQLDELVKSKFVEMFGDVEEQVCIKEICDVSGGYSFKSGDISVNSGIRVLQIGNVALNDVSWEVTNYLPKDFEKKHETFLLKEDDIVMALTRPIIQSLGNVKTCLVKSTDLPCLLNQRVGKIRAKFGTNIRFVYCCFMQHSFTDYVQSCCKGSSQPNMSTKDIENYEIPKVDENLQNTFAEYVKKIDTAKSIIKTQLADLQELLDSKMDEYFEA